MIFIITHPKLSEGEFKELGFNQIIKKQEGLEVISFEVLSKEKAGQVIDQEKMLSLIGFWTKLFCRLIVFKTSSR